MSDERYFLGRRLEKPPTFVDGIGPPLEQLWEDYGCENAENRQDEGRDIRALILEVKRLRALSGQEGA